MSKYTKEQLEVMSDLEVNKVLEKLTGMYCEDVNGKYIKTVDYCNDPSAIMPLAFEHKIELHWYPSSCMAVEYNFKKDDCDVLTFENNKPLRTIACCLILILGA